MTQMPMAAERLLTWLDVERALKQATQLWNHLPPMVQSVDCYQDGMEIVHADANAVQHWLESIFGRAFSADAHAWQLRLRAGDGHYPITLKQAPPAEPAPPLPLYPLWREVAYLSDASGDAPVLGNVPLGFTGGPRMLAFHSFKGGVGRTTALMTYVTAQLYAANPGQSVKALVVDADLEAPGVTFWLDDVNRPQVSFVQFLEAMHYPPVSTQASLDFFAAELKKTSLDVDGTLRELFVLPAALDLTEILDMPVQPSHLSRNLDNPWILTDYLYALGQRLGVDAVFIDLRAGLSELASPVIFDPRVEHYFVTTVATQSVSGMSEVLRRVHAFHRALPPAQSIQAKPSVILSQLTPNLRRLPDYSRAKECIEQAYPPLGAADASDVLMEDSVEWLETDFSESLMAISSIRDAFDLLKTSSLYRHAQEWAARPTAGQVVPAASRMAIAQALLNICKKEYAEHSGTDDWLTTEPLRNLGKHFSSDMPNAVVIGAKGAGKTFTFLQICRSKNWAAYLRRVDETPQQPEAAAQRLIFPVLWSGNVEGSSKLTVADTRESTIKQFGRVVSPLTLSNIERQISDNLKSDTLHWDDFWEKLITTSLGESTKTLADLNQRMAMQGQSVVLVFDGIEDVFKHPNDPEQAQAIESLLKLVNRLGELPNPALGALIFVRSDYVQATIKQNLGQFLSRFSAFALTWNPESFLRLAYWLSAKAGLSGTTPDQAHTLPIQTLIDKLTELWGPKLGKPNSREGRSVRWVYAALCDLAGRFQARDLVRFFRFAAEEALQHASAFWPDRILSPESMRKAIPKCSQEKVQEAKLEIEPLKAWLERMDSEQIAERAIPFSAASVKLMPDELAVLRELGVVYEDQDPELGDKRLFLPEIYRAGLGFDLSAGRPKIQALLKKNLGKMPF